MNRVMMTLSRIRVVLVLLAVGALCACGQSSQPAHGQEPDLVSELLRLREELQPTPNGEDAWPRYVALFRDTLGMGSYGDYGASELASLYEQVGSAVFAGLLAGDMRDPRHRAQFETVDRLGPVRDALRHATDAPNCEAPIFADEHLLLSLRGTPVGLADAAPGDASSAYSEPTRMLFPLLLRFLCADARVASDRADFDRATDDYARLLVMSEHAGATPLVVGQTIRFQIVHDTLQEIRRTVLETDWPVEAIDAMLALLAPEQREYRIGPYLERVAASNAELHARYHAAQNESARKGSLRGRLGILPHNPRAMRKASEAYYLAAAEVADGPRSARVVVYEGNDDDAEIARGEIKRLFIQRDTTRAQLVATRIVLLLEQHHALTGEWPAALEDIMAREETLDPNTLTPFVYELTPEGPFPFSLAAPAEADFLPADQRNFTKPRGPVDERYLGIEAAP